MEWFLTELPAYNQENDWKKGAASAFEIWALVVYHFKKDLSSSSSMK